MPKKVELTEKWVRQYAQANNIDEDVMIRLFQNNALNPAAIKAFLIKFNMDKILAETVLNKNQAKTVLAKEYGVSASNIETVIYNKNTVSKGKQCVICGNEMTRYKFTKNQGVCDDCLIKQANVSL